MRKYPLGTVIEHEIFVCTLGNTPTKVYRLVMNCPALGRIFHQNCQILVPFVEIFP